jgi:uncharacterized protein YycO
MRQLLFFLTIIINLSASAQDNNEFKLQQGDLLFQDIDCGPLCEGIETVTTGYRGAHLSHVGIVDQNKQGEWIVLEAISPHVKATPLKKFLERSLDQNGNPKVLVGRLKKEYQHLIPGAISITKELLGRPYDKVYNLKDSSYYCSELIYVAFHKANSGTPVFKLNPMTFQDPETGKTFPAWVEYYEELDSSIPEGEPGLNPGGLSRSDKLEIIHYYGKPENFHPKR